MANRSKGLRAVALTTAFCVNFALVSCTSKANEPAGAPSRAATGGVDLSRLFQIASDFPTGYPATPNPIPGVGKPDATQAEIIGDYVSFGRPLTADPEPCRPLLKPVQAKEGTNRASVSSVTGVQDAFIAVTATDPVSVPAPIPDSGCERFTFDVRGAIPDGLVEQLAVPRFDDAIAYALRVGHPGPLVEYFYTAILNGHTFVSIWARVPGDFAPEPALPDLLTKAVAAIRGQ
jgi:Domain of unknown function (DUF5642)